MAQRPASSALRFSPGSASEISPTLKARGRQTTSAGLPSMGGAPAARCLWWAASRFAARRPSGPPAPPMTATAAAPPGPESATRRLPFSEVEKTTCTMLLPPYQRTTAWSSDHTAHTRPAATSTATPAIRPMLHWPMR